ncbi:hypothetical protein D3C71_838380 [compost metagenome]
MPRVTSAGRREAGARRGRPSASRTAQALRRPSSAPGTVASSGGGTTAQSRNTASPMSSSGPDSMYIACPWLSPAIRCAVMPRLRATACSKPPMSRAFATARIWSSARAFATLGSVTACQPAGRPASAGKRYSGPRCEYGRLWLCVRTLPSGCFTRSATVFIVSSRGAPSTVYEGFAPGFTSSATSSG